MKSKIISFIITKGLIIGGFFMLIIAIIILNNGVVKKRITEQNKIVTAKVLETPKDCDNLGQRGGYYKLTYNGQVFLKKGNRLICETIIGKSDIEVLTNDNKDKIVFLNEYEESNDFWSGILLGIIGIVIAYKGWKK
ncbi:hypothetical protein PXC01_14230 [Maribacter sp. M208]|uniref:hypothetical protein n=1 Tax=Maribacter huludaoensis TaxID=3030010 RepID=UPI0023ED947D|nr:hypothetical protein [Maribacter huludaoensis]MDF4222757.1 hypothetical protein [Maribacter huludaoensis]